MTTSIRYPSIAARLLPFLAWLPLLNRGTVRADLMAGLTGAIVVLPQGVAFATIAGMPPEYGLYAGMIPAITGIYQHLDKSVCATCDKRIFQECGPGPTQQA